MNDLPPYSTIVKCAKCGHDRATTWYQPAVSWRFDHPGEAAQWVTQEHLRRTCERCYCVWHEACVPQDTQP